MQPPPSPAKLWLFVALAGFGLVLMATGLWITFNNLRQSSSGKANLPEGARLVGQIKKNTVSLTALSPDGSLFALAAADEVSAYQLPRLAQLFNSKTDAPITALTFSFDNQFLAAGLEDGTLVVFQVSNGKSAQMLSGASSEVGRLAFSSDGQSLAAIYAGGPIFVWAWPGGENLLTLNGSSAPFLDLIFSPDVHLLAACDEGGTIYLWDYLTGQLLQTFASPGSSTSPSFNARLAFSSDGQYLAAVLPNQVQIWEVAGGNLFRTLNFSGNGTGAQANTTALSFVYLQDGWYLACGCHGDLIIWRVSDGRLISQIALDDGLANSLVMLTNGEILFPSIHDNQLDLLAWDMGGLTENLPVATPAALAPAPSPTNTLSPSQTPPPTATLLPTLTFTPQATSTPAPTNTPPPTPTPALTNPADGAALIYIPSGEFTMGSNANSDPYFWGAEGPEHEVFLDDYWIYQTEVTNAMYQACVADQKCPLPQWPRSATRDEYYPNPQYANYPVIFVSYVHAQSYCRWAEAALPTEAQWEKAARGDDRRLFPWGNTPPTNGQINFGNRDTAEVGSFPGDVSPYGVLDMAGNVWEWVFDYFQATFYSASSSNNPRGPASGTRRVIRGGAFFGDAGAVRTVVRASENPNSTFEAVGFRCALEALP